MGDNNFTKYAQELRAAVGSPFVNGVPWCAIFVDWCIFKRYGKEEAERLLHGWSMSCGEIRDSHPAETLIDTVLIAMTGNFYLWVAEQKSFDRFEKDLQQLNIILK